MENFFATKFKASFHEVFLKTPLCLIKGYFNLSSDLTNSQEANCPFTHNEPLLGESKSGSTPFILFSSLSNWIPHPTPQYGQIVFVLVSLVGSVLLISFLSTKAPVGQVLIH